jgi:hypothetical protein
MPTPFPPLPSVSLTRQQKGRLRKRDWRGKEEVSQIIRKRLVKLFNTLWVSTFMQLAHQDLSCQGFKLMFSRSGVRRSTELEFLKRLWGLGTEEEEGYRTGPPAYIGWRNSFLGMDSGAPYTFKNTSSVARWLRLSRSRKLLFLSYTYSELKNLPGPPFTKRIETDNVPPPPPPSFIILY